MPKQIKEIGVFSKKQRMLICALILMVVVSVTGISFWLGNQGDKIADSNVQQYLSEISYQTSRKVNQRVDVNFDTLLELKDNLANVAESETQMIINNVLAHSAFENVGFINTQGIFDSGELQIDVSQTNIPAEIRNGSISLTNELINTEDGRQGVVYAVPCYTDGNIALAGWVPDDTMILLLNTDTFNGVGFSHIVANNGDFILKSQNENALLNKGVNFFDEFTKIATLKDDSKLSVMQDSMLAKGSGMLEYSVEDSGGRTLVYTPLDKGNWYLLSIVPSDIYGYNINHFTTQSIYAVAGISILLFSILSLAILMISSKKNKLISNIAYIDPVTKGFTKARFDQYIHAVMQDFSPFSFVLLDIRKFKLINDLVGSNGGDDVLRHVHRCIKKHLKEDEYVSRQQGDNFEILLRTVDKEEISKRLLAIAEEINRFNDEREEPYYLPIDCGVYFVDKVSDDLIQIRDRANSARKNNKENSQMHLCSCVYYNDLERLQMVQEKAIDNAMENALKNEEFAVYLQPKVNIANNKVAGCEALIRWNSPTLGFLPPNKFIPYFEKTGFIVKLDQFVFEKVCQQLRIWLDQGIEPVPISVNLSRRDLYDSDYLVRYKEIQERYAVPSHLLEIEFTETLFFENLDLLKKAIDEVHEAGYLCSIDDFGSGYSSLALLKEIPVDILKLDKTFFDNMSDTRGEKVIEHVIALAKDLDMATIAEGVETLIQVERLKHMKCDMIQGYVYYKPMCIEDFNTIVEHNFEIVDTANKER